jgi:predicted KAP-like P-loop ATPase
MWADTETDRDYLNYGELAEVVALMLADPKLLPLSIGVSGGWGTGKSSFLKMVEARLPKPPEPKGEGKSRRYIVVHYDAWLYQGYDDARAALMDTISSRLLKEAEQKPTSIREKAVRLFRRVDKLRVLGLGMDLAMLAGGLPPPGAVGKLTGAFHRMVGAGVTAQDVTDVREAAKKGGEDLKGALRPEEKETPPHEIAEFRREFAEVLTDLDAVLVVFIDNLDRCLPTQVIHTLEALRLFLFMGNTAFCVAADEDMVRGAIRQHFEGIEGDHVRDYLDKLVQVPIRVPRLGVPEVTSYLMQLFAEDDPDVPPERVVHLREGIAEALRNAWRGDAPGAAEAARLVSDSPSQRLVALFETAERMAPLLVSSTAVNGNPRIIKRLLNTVRIRTKLAAVRKLEADEAVIAKLALFERCMGEKAAAVLYREVLAAADGRSSRMAELEGCKDQAAFAKALPPEWQGAEAETFLRDWVLLRPPLADLDLSGLSYLSRDTVTLAGRRRGLSAQAAEQLKALCAIEKLPSRAADLAALGVPAHERAEVMDAIFSIMRRHKDWSQATPRELNGARALARLDPGLAASLSDFLRDVAGPKPSATIKVVLDGLKPGKG